MTLNEQQTLASAWFRQLRDAICTEFETIEKGYGSAGAFVRTAWNREGGGGGEMSIMKGGVFEKVGVNISTVHGEFSEQFRKEMPGGSDMPYFWASGISLVAHMCSPLVPAVHMNTRMIVVSSNPPEAQSLKPKTRLWFGGGADLTPMIPNDQDTADFHNALKAACDAFDESYYPTFKQACDDYFFLKHRGEPRGVGGIFYDYVNTGDWQTDFRFTQEVGKTFLATYPKLVRRHMHAPWSKEQRAWQLQKRGRYVEFNLLYDRGTRFGLMTGGNTEAILMSLPPEVTWP